MLSWLQQVRVTRSQDKIFTEKRLCIIRQAYKRVEEAKATAKYMDEKVAHYEAILAGLVPDDTNPNNWTPENRPKH